MAKKGGKGWKRVTKIAGGASTGAVAGAAVGAKIAPFLLPVDPTGVASVTICSVLGAIGGACGFGIERGDED